MAEKQRGSAVVRYFIAGSVLVITVALIITLYISSLVARRGIVESTQAANIALTQVFVNELWPTLRADYALLREVAPSDLPRAPQISHFDSAVRLFGQSTDILKIKIYDLHGHTLYSSDPQQIGQEMARNGGFQSARRGTPASELTYRGEFGSFDGAVHSRNLVSSYLPIFDDGHQVEAVVEIYTDRTGAIASSDRSLWLLAMVLVPLFYAANGLLVYLVWRVDRVRQVQHDQLDSQSQELKRLAEDNQAARIVAESADRAKSDFLANVSHEIRTPMNAIVGFSHLALGGEVSGRDREYFRKISESAQLLLQVINDILDFSKIEAGHLGIERTEFNLEEVLSKVLSVTEGRGREKGLALAVMLDPGVPTRLLGDPLRLAQVLTNLASNATKFTAHGEVAIHVGVVSVTDDEVRLRLSVRDTGIGLTPEQVERLFRPFVQVDTSSTRKFGGTGLGLVICKHLVELMGGRIGLQSALGEGTVASFEMPFGRCPEPAATTLLSADETVLLAAPPGLAREACLSALRRIGGAVCEVDTASPSIGPPPTPHLLRVAVAGTPSAMTDAVLPDPGAAPLLIVCPPTMTHLDLVADEPADRLRIVTEPVTPWKIRAAVATLLGRAEAASGQFVDRHPAEAASQRFAGRRVLLAEDNAVNQQVAQELLEAWGLQVTIAGTGAEALERLEQSSFDLVLMDVQMPVMDGYEATRRIRQTHCGATLPVIAMTAHAMSGHLDRCLEAGMNDYVVKPIDPRHLYALIARWCSTAGAEQESGATAEPIPGDEFDRLAPDIDAASGLRHTNGNRGTLTRALERFRTDGGAITDKIRRLSTRGDFAALKAVVHSLKGSAATMGMTSVASAAQAADALLNDQPAAQIDWPAIRGAAERLAAQLDAVNARLADWTPAVAPARSLPAPATPASARTALSHAVELLADGDVAAIDVLDALAPTFKDGPWVADYRRLREVAAAFEFDAAWLAAQRLLAQLAAATSPTAPGEARHD